MVKRRKTIIFLVTIIVISWVVYVEVHDRKWLEARVHRTNAAIIMAAMYRLTSDGKELPPNLDGLIPYYVPYLLRPNFRRGDSDTIESTIEASHYLRETYNARIERDDAGFRGYVWLSDGTLLYESEW